MGINGCWLGLYTTYSLQIAIIIIIIGAISYWSRGICVNYETINQVSNFCLFAHNISDKYINYVLAGPGARCDERAEQGCLSIRR